MDSIQKKVANLSIYDVKSAFRKAQNIMMNYTEMEAKVREATNNEPWGASSTAMQEIAQETYNYNSFNEIMHMIYRRFTEKSSEEWRQIYKALQLLEYLIKNGSERVIDDARAHQATIKVLRQFYYVDEKMVDQGANVRNRAKHVIELLQDSDTLRLERKKAKQNKQKYLGNSSEGFGSRSSRYNASTFPGYYSERNDELGASRSTAHVFGSGGGFMSNSVDRSNRVYGDGGGFGGEPAELLTMRAREQSESLTQPYNEYPESSHKKRTPTSEPKPQIVPNLLDLDDTDTTVSEKDIHPKQATVITSSNTKLESTLDNDEDDFTEFQSANSVSTQPINTISQTIHQTSFSSAPINVHTPMNLLNSSNATSNSSKMTNVTLPFEDPSKRSGLKNKTSMNSNHKGTNDTQDMFASLWQAARESKT